MLKKHIHKILFCLTMLGSTSLQAAHLLLQDEGKNDDQETAVIPQPITGYYNHTLKHSKKPIDNSVDLDDLAREQQDLTENRIAEKLKNRQDTIFFMVILYNKQTETRSKFFFFNSDPNTAQDVVWKVQRSHTCHVISHTKPMLSPHILFQLLGWLEQEKSKYRPIFIYASSAICGTCHAIIISFFNLHILSSAKGCNGCDSIDLANACPLARQYIERGLTFPLAKKLLSSTLRLTYEHRLKLLQSENSQLKQALTLSKNAEQKATKLLRKKEDSQKEQSHLQNKHKSLLQSYRNLVVKKNKEIETLKSLLKDRIELPYSPLKGHTASVNSVAVTNDNKYIVSGSSDRTIRIWDFKRGNELPYSPLKGHINEVTSVVVTKDNKYIVSGSKDKTICIWDFKTGKQLPYSPLKGHTNVVKSVAVADDNTYIVSGSNDHTIRIWDFKTGKELPYSPLKGHTNVVLSVRITKHNKYIVSGSGDRTICIWDLKTGKQLSYSPLKGHTYLINNVTVTNDDKFIVSCSGNGTIRIWDFKTGKELPYSPLTGYTNWVFSVEVTKDNKYIISGSLGRSIRIFDFKTGKQLPYIPFTSHTSSVWSVALTSNDKYIISGSNDKTIRIWDLQLFAYLAQEDYEHNQNEIFDID